MVLVPVLCDIHAAADPDLIIRTSGELRISNFLIWQSAYSEYFFTEVLWPDFTRENLYEAIVSFQQRKRRLGKTTNIKNNSGKLSNGSFLKNYPLNNQI